MLDERLETASEIGETRCVSFDRSNRLKAVLGPTNTGKTHFAVERLCAHSSGVMGFPLRLLAREVYDRVVAIKGATQVGLITGEERIMPPDARWLLCTVESMPVDRDVAFVALDEAQLGIDDERGHVFTNRLLNVRGREETLILGAETLKPLIRTLLPDTEIITRPRFSQLSYAGPRKLSRLPPRTAIIAFSADDVYAIAEQVRRHAGGAAIVMGNLSPRTRNAQVAMYQAGEVDYIVSTDAIGMGLNMDIGHVAFAGLSKFDGIKRRRLTVAEMAQIAGRAGRHQRDGTFGIAVTGPNPPEFSDVEIERIENHRFPPIGWLYWRNTDLDFSSSGTLVDSLEMPPPRPELRPTPEAGDHAVLRSLRAIPDIDNLAQGETLTRRLWDACGLPDFRGAGPEFHARFVARLYQYLATGSGHIPSRIVAEEITRLDSVQGAIPALAGRLAAIRTWTYVANRPDWLEDPGQWADRTRELEEKLSDALHRKLTERFVDKRSTRLLKEKGLAGSPGDFCIDDAGIVHVLDEPVGTLLGFRFAPFLAARSGDAKRFLDAAETQLPEELSRRANLCACAADAEFNLRLEAGQVPAILWRNGQIATLKRGRDLLAPDLTLDASVARLEQRHRDAVRIRAGRYLSDHIQNRLKPLARIAKMAFSPETPSVVRATLAPLAEAGGVILRTELEECLRNLTPEQRHSLKRLGLSMGRLTVFHSGMLKPSAMRLRLALAAVRVGQPMPPLPLPGLTLLHRPSSDLADAAERAGYYRFGDQLLRFDLLERVASKVHEQRKGQAPFTPDTALATSIGLGGETLQRILRRLGFVPTGRPEANAWRWRGPNRVPEKTIARRSNRPSKAQAN